MVAGVLHPKILKICIPRINLIKCLPDQLQYLLHLKLIIHHLIRANSNHPLAIKHQRNWTMLLISRINLSRVFNKRTVCLQEPWTALWECFIHQMKTTKVNNRTQLEFLMGMNNNILKTSLKMRFQVNSTARKKQRNASLSLQIVTPFKEEIAKTNKSLNSILKRQLTLLKPNYQRECLN